MAKKKPARKPGGKKAIKKPAKKNVKPKKVVKKTKKIPAKKTKTAKKSPVKKVKSAAKKVKIIKKKPVKKSVSVRAKKMQKPEKKSLVSIHPKVRPVIKKEPAKPTKIVIPRTHAKGSVKYEPEFTKSVLDPGMLQQSTGPIVRYSDADLTEFKEIILKKLDAAKKELTYLQGLITRKDESGDMDEARYMTMEDGSVSMEREQLSQMASRQITFIDHLEKALMRIENKTYGICRVTGKLIDKARLRAVPHATLSIEAKQMMNK